MKKGVPVVSARLVIRRIIYSLSDNKCFHIEHLPIRQEQSYGIAAACKSLNVHRNVCLSVTYPGCLHYNTRGTYDLNQSIAYVFGKPVSDIYYSVIRRIRRKGNKHTSTYCHAYSIIILCSVSLCNHLQFILLRPHRLNCQIHACSDRITVYIIPYIYRAGSFMFTAEKLTACDIRTEVSFNAKALKSLFMFLIAL